MRFTKENIIDLKESEVFVFGANEKGIHGAGAARLALQWGAVYGEGYGMKGMTFAIPTKDKNIQTLPLPDIKIYIDAFILFAATRPEYTFLVTKIGTGLAGLFIKDIAPLFKDATLYNNIILPEEFWDILSEQMETTDET